MKKQIGTNNNNFKNDQWPTGSVILYYKIIFIYGTETAEFLLAHWQAFQIPASRP